MCKSCSNVNGRTENTNIADFAKRKGHASPEVNAAPKQPKWQIPTILTYLWVLGILQVQLIQDLLCLLSIAVPALEPQEQEDRVDLHHLCHLKKYEAGLFSSKIV